MRTIRLSILARRPGRSAALPLRRRTLTSPHSAAKHRRPGVGRGSARRHVAGLTQPTQAAPPGGRAGRPSQPLGKRKRAGTRPNRLLALSPRPARRGFEGRTSSKSGFASGKSRRVARRLHAEFALEAAERDTAPWNATVPESLQPFLAERQASLQCPTCNARQAPSLQCRRCKCDLILVCAVHEQQRRLHAQLLRQLADADYGTALETARARWALAPDVSAARLLSVCLLLLGRFEAAEAVCDRVEKG